MAKQIPTEQLLALHHKLEDYQRYSQERSELIQQMAEAFNVSPSTVRRQLQKIIKPQLIQRDDFNTPRIMSHEQMLEYCQLIAALKLRTSNKQGRHLSTGSCIKLLETHGVTTHKGLIQPPTGLLKKATVNRYLQRWQLNYSNLHLQPPIVRFQAAHSNDCWQFDFSSSDLKKLTDRSGNTYNLKLITLTDDRSGFLFGKYGALAGEDATAALEFFFLAMAPKPDKSVPFQGIPKLIYMDNGPVAKSLIFKRVMEYLGVEIRVHYPDGKDGRRKTARSKGKIERPYRTVKEQFETLFHFHEPTSVDEANQWLANYLKQYNDGLHREGKLTRLEAWKQCLPDSGYRAMCSKEQFANMLREPQTREVGTDACISLDGVKYQLTADLAGEKVVVLPSLNDSDIYIEFSGNKLGPFYRSGGPDTLLDFRSHPKTYQEKVVDAIEVLSDEISISRSVLNGEDDGLKLILSESNLLEPNNIPSIPFSSESPILKNEYPDQLAAKLDIAKQLGRPLAELSTHQQNFINEAIRQSLNKKELQHQVAHYFSLKLCVNNNKEQS